LILRERQQLAGGWRELHNEGLHDVCCSLGDHTHDDGMSRAGVTDGKYRNACGNVVRKYEYLVTDGSILLELATEQRRVDRIEGRLVAVVNTAMNVLRYGTNSILKRNSDSSLPKALTSFLVCLYQKDERTLDNFRAVTFRVCSPQQ